MLSYIIYNMHQGSQPLLHTQIMNKLQTCYWMWNVSTCVLKMSEFLEPEWIVCFIQIFWFDLWSFDNPLYIIWSRLFGCELKHKYKYSIF